MQFLIDTETDPAPHLRLIANLILAVANEEKPTERSTPEPTIVPLPPSATFEGLDKFPLVVTPVASVVPAPPPPYVPQGPTTTPLNVSPVTMTGEAFGVVPPPPPPPPTAETVTAPVVPPAPTTGAPVVPPPPVESASVETTTAPGIVERDSAGIPWDARVHSDTMKKNADGTWRFRRNLDDAVKGAVMAELRGLTVRSSAGSMLVPPPPITPGTATTLNFTPAEIAAAGVVPPPPPPPPPPVTTGVVPPPPVSLPPTLPVPPAITVGVPDTTQPGVLPALDFAGLLRKVNPAISQGRLTHPQLMEACKAAGLDSVAALAVTPTAILVVDAYLARWIG